MDAGTVGRGGHWLETQSAEYDLVKYHLVSATQHLGVVEKLSVWKIVNPELQYRFEKRASGMLRLQSWYDAEHCVGINSLENICSHGFQADPNQEDNGILVPVGIIPSEGDSQLQRECACVLLDVAVGRSFVYDGNLQGKQIPQGYDSLYIPAQPLDRNKDGKFSLQEYQNAANFDFRASSGYSHRYYVGDLNQVCPKYIVRYQMQKMRPGRIPDLEIEDTQYVDPISLQPAERHAQPSSGFDKRIVSIDIAFAQALEDLGKVRADPTAAAKSQWIKKQLSVVEEKVRAINLNYAEVSEAIQEAAAQAQRRLQDLVRQKLELCLSLEIELRRQTEQVDWLDGVLTSELQRIKSAMVDAPTPSIKRKLMLRFLKLWKQHSLHRNAISRAKPHELQALSSLHPDLRVQPDIRIFVDPFYATNSISARGQSFGGKFTDASKGRESGSEEHEGMVNEFTQRAVDHHYFNTPTESSHPYLSSSVRALIDQEMSTIQKMVSATAKQGHLQLPSSITGVPLSGSGLHQPLLSMHAVLDMLRSLPSPIVPEDTHKEAAPPMSLDTEQHLMHAFVESVLEANASPFPNEPQSSPRPPQDHPEPFSPPVPPEPPTPSAVDRAASRSPSEVMMQSPQTQLPEMTEIEELRNTNRPNGSQPPPSIETDGLEDVEMTIPQLKQIVLAFRNLYMSDLSAKKMKQLQIRLNAGIENQGHRCLERSRILGRNDNEMQSLYYCLPFFSKAPVLKMIYSTVEHARSLEELYQRTIKNRNPTVLLIRSGEFRFGAYLSHSPLPTCSWSGSPACFIFSITLNMKIPYHARQVAMDSKMKEPMALFGQDDRLFVGNGDLTIDEHLATGTSEIENCYGLGLETQSSEAMCLLAGKPVFHIDELEVWTISP